MVDKRVLRWGHLQQALPTAREMHSWAIQCVDDNVAIVTGAASSNLFALDVDVNDYDFAEADWYSRRVLSWRLSITMEAAFCVEALEEALARHGKPEISNTDQGSQFTSQEFTGVLSKAGVAISMDGKGAWRDNVFVERLWRSIKYEEVYLHGYDSVGEARALIGRYLTLYNGRRPHSSLDRQTPDQAYIDRLPQPVVA